MKLNPLEKELAHQMGRCGIDKETAWTLFLGLCHSQQAISSMLAFIRGFEQEHHTLPTVAHLSRIMAPILERFPQPETEAADTPSAP